MWKKLLALILIAVIIAGCVEKTKNDVNSINKNNSKNNSKIWYQYMYTGPGDRKNAEDARMAVNPYLVELGWRQGLAVVSYSSTTNLSIVILIPFKLMDESTDRINQTLKNYSFYPVRFNEIVQ